MKNGRSCILTYHSLDPSGSVISIAPHVFREQMAFLADTGTPVVPLHAVRDTPGAVALTFDDGFRNFFEQAFPVLQRYGFPATVFVVSGYCNGRNNWPTQPRNTGVPILELMDWSKIQEVANAGIEIGCHTATHPRLGLLSPENVENELAASRAAIEDQIGRAVRAFAYPYGESTALVRKAVRGHFQWACGTRLAYLSSAADPLNLPRIDVYYLQKRLCFQGLHSIHGSTYLAVRGLLRGLRQTFPRGTRGI
jgi:peptidoglycan/xylan/chitin deacetylase (PgdA/CDA1 family)